MTINEFSYVWNQVSRFAVPLFILMSGFLLHYAELKAVPGIARASDSPSHQWSRLRASLFFVRFYFNCKRSFMVYLVYPRLLAYRPFSHAAQAIKVNNYQAGSWLVWLKNERGTTSSSCLSGLCLFWYGSSPALAMQSGLPELPHAPIPPFAL